MDFTLNLISFVVEVAFELGRILRGFDGFRFYRVEYTI